MMETSTRVTRRLLLLIATTLVGCASTSGVPSRTHASELAEEFSQDLITTAELNRLNQGASVMDLVEHARPWFLHPRGSTAAVSIDGAPPAELAVLRSMAVGSVKEIRLVRAGASTSPSLRRDGSAMVGDVILIVTGARSR